MQRLYEQNCKISEYNINNYFEYKDVNLFGQDKSKYIRSKKFDNRLNTF